MLDSVSACSDISLGNEVEVTLMMMMMTRSLRLRLFLETLFWSRAVGDFAHDHQRSAIMIGSDFSKRDLQIQAEELQDSHGRFSERT
jgi:hypothetical protein